MWPRENGTICPFGIFGQSETNPYYEDNMGLVAFFLLLYAFWLCSALPNTTFQGNMSTFEVKTAVKLLKRGQEGQMVPISHRYRGDEKNEENVWVQVSVQRLPSKAYQARQRFSNGPAMLHHTTEALSKSWKACLNCPCHRYVSKHVICLRETWIFALQRKIKIRQEPGRDWNLEIIEPINFIRVCIYIYISTYAYSLCDWGQAQVAGEGHVWELFYGQVLDATPFQCASFAHDLGCLELACETYIRCSFSSREVRNGDLICLSWILEET